MARKRRTKNYPGRRQNLSEQVKIPLNVVGFGGSQLPYSYLSHTVGEYNPRLQGKAALETWERMLTDPQIKGISRIIDLPIRAAKWRVEPADAKTSTDVEVAEFVEENLFSGMEVTWDDVLRQMLGSVMRGFSVHEKEFAQVNGMVRLVALWDRLQTTIERFTYAGDRVTGVVQYGADSSGKTRSETIERERLLITTYEGRGGNAAGTPLCRPMYGPWYIKHPVLKLVSIGLENSLVGTVWAKVPRSMTDEDRTTLRAAIEALRVRDHTGFVLDADVVLDILEGKRNPLDALPLIEYLDNQLAKVALAQFMNLGTGQGGSGSRAVSEDHSKIFLLSLNALADMVEEIINRYLIPQLVGFNWPGLAAFPKIRHADIARQLNLANVGDALQKLFTSGVLNWTDDVENTVRDWYDFNPLPDGFTPPVRPPAAPAGGTPPDTRPPGGGETDPNDPDRKDHTEHAGHGPGCSCDEHQLTERPAPPMFDQVNDQFQTRASAILGQMVSSLQARAQALLSRLGAEGSLEQARVYTALSRLDLPRRGELRVALADYFDAVAQNGRQAAIEVQGNAPEISPGLRHWMTAQVDLLTNRLVDQLKGAFLQSVLNGVTAGVADDQLVASAAQAARDRLNTDFRNTFREALAEFAERLATEVSFTSSSHSGDPVT